MYKKIFLLFASLSLLMSTALWAASEPVTVLQGIASHMIAGLKANKATLKTKPTTVYNLAYQYVVPHADLAEMSKRVLPRDVWQKASQAQRQQFQKAFTTTLIRTYASALTSYQDQAIHFYPVRGGAQGKNIEVNSEITGGGNEPIRVTYRMVRNQGDWKLYDMSVEGVSMLDSFRSQFADLLGHGDIQDLLARMNAHNQG